jgi:hypothetical protein
MKLVRLTLSALALAACAGERPKESPPPAPAPAAGETRLTAKPVAAPAPAPAPPAGPAHKTFHYKSESVPGVFDQWGTGHLDPQTESSFAAGVRYDCPGAGRLRVESEADPEGSQLRIGVFSNGKELAVTRRLEPLEVPIDAAGPCYVVIRVQDFSWECTFRIKATFTPEKLRP